MAKWRMAKIVGEGHGFGQILVQVEIASERPGDLRDLQAVRKPRAEKVAFMIDKNLRLVLKAPEGVRVDDAIAITLVVASAARRRLAMAATVRTLGASRVWG